MKNNAMSRPLYEVDPQIAAAISNEERRQHEGLELIASENFVSEAVLEAAGSVFTNKYAEGYPGKRYYGGCEFTDVVEELARERAKKLFGAEHANVQPHSGSSANQEAYAAVLQPGDTILGLNLAHGGHLTHGHHLNFSGKTYKIVPYGVTKETETIDYDELEKLAVQERPKLIIGGGSAYPRISTSRACARLRIKSALSTWSTWLTSLDWSLEERILRPCRTRRSSLRPPIRHCAARAPD